MNPSNDIIVLHRALQTPVVAASWQFHNFLVMDDLGKPSVYAAKHSEAWGSTDLVE